MYEPGGIDVEGKQSWIVGNPVSFSFVSCSTLSANVSTVGTLQGSPSQRNENWCLTKAN